MNEVHDRVRAALHDALDGVPLHPDERDVGRRVAARRRRRTTTRVAVIGAAATAAVTGMVLTNSGLADRSTATIPSSTTTVAVPVAEGLVTTVPAPAPPPPSTAVDATVAAVPTSYRIVTRVGSTLVEMSSTGEQRQVAVLPEVPGVDPVLWAAGDRLVVTYLGRTLLYDTTTWAPPVELGEYRSLGIAPDGDGYWAADPSTSPPADGMVRWRRYGWDGVATGPVTPALQYPLAIGALDGGIAVWERGTQRVVVSAGPRVEDIGTAVPAAARGHLVAFATATDEVHVHDVSTGTTRSIAVGTAMKVDVAMSGALSADGRRLALLVNSERPADAAIVLVDLADDTARVVLTGARVLDWSADSRTALFARGDTVLALDVTSGEIAELPLPPGASPGLVVLAP